MFPIGRVDISLMHHSIPAVPSRQLKRPHTQEFAIQGKENGNGGGGVSLGGRAGDGAGHSWN